MLDRTRVQWADISAAARRTSEDLVGKDWVQAGIKARVLLADLADELDRLKVERNEWREACYGFLSAMSPTDPDGRWGRLERAEETARVVVNKTTKGAAGGR
jgi:hypothetical protein